MQTIGSKPCKRPSRLHQGTSARAARKRRVRRRKCTARSCAEANRGSRSRRHSIVTVSEVRQTTDHAKAALANLMYVTCASVASAERWSSSRKSQKRAAETCVPKNGELLRVKCRKNGATWKIENSCRFHLQYSRKEKITEHKNTRQAERSLTVRISSRMEPRSFASRTNVKLHVVQQLSHKCIEKFAYAIARRETS